MATQAQARQAAKARVRNIKRALRKVDTKLEVMERRLDKLLERERLIQTQGFNSFLEETRDFYELIRSFEATMVATMTIFMID